MASKGQEFVKYSQDIKETIYQELKLGKSCSELSRIYNVNKKTISTWQQKIRHADKYPGQGMKRGKQNKKDLTKEDYAERYEIIKKYQAFFKAQRERK